MEHRFIQHLFKKRVEVLGESVLQAIKTLKRRKRQEQHHNNLYVPHQFDVQWKMVIVVCRFYCVGKSFGQRLNHLSFGVSHACLVQWQRATFVCPFCSLGKGPEQRLNHLYLGVSETILTCVVQW